MTRCYGCVMTQNLSESAPQELSGEDWTATKLNEADVKAHYANLNASPLNGADNVVYAVKIYGEPKDVRVQVAMNLRSLALVGRTPFDSVQDWVNQHRSVGA